MTVPAGAMAPAQPTRPRRRRPLLWVAVVLGALGVALVLGPPAAEGPPLDPSSAGPSGTKAMVDTLRELGADVSVEGLSADGRAGLPAVGRGRGAQVLLLVDSLSDRQRDALRTWTEAGGTLVLADPSSPLNPVGSGVPAAVGPLEPELRRRCAVPALQRAERIVAPGATLLPVPPAGTGCFSREGDAWLVVLSAGRGTLVVLGGAEAFTNSQLGRADNAVLAASLLAPRRDDRVAVLWVQPAGSGEEPLIDLVPRGVKLAVLQLGVAFVVVVLWRGRRLGRPVVEPQPVAVEGSESVAAVGRLLQRARARSQAAGILRDDLRRTLGRRMGLPVDAPADQVADAAAARSGVSRERVLGVLAGDDPTTEDALVGLAQSVESLRREVDHGS